jgi:hypothetical protein
LLPRVECLAVTRCFRFKPRMREWQVACGRGRFWREPDIRRQRRKGERTGGASPHTVRQTWIFHKHNGLLLLTLHPIAICQIDGTSLERGPSSASQRTVGANRRLSKSVPRLRFIGTISVRKPRTCCGPNLIGPLGEDRSDAADAGRSPFTCIGGRSLVVEISTKGCHHRELQ